MEAGPPKTKAKERLPPPLDSPRYAWVVVAAAFTLMFVGFGAAYSFAAFFTAFEAEFGASRGDIALVFSLAAFLWFLSGAPAGMLADRYGVRRVALAGVACMARRSGSLASTALARRALRHLQHRPRGRRRPGVCALRSARCSRGSTPTAPSPPGLRWPGSAPAISPGR